MDTLEIIRQIETDPGVRAQLRSVLLGDELLGMPAQVAELRRSIGELAEAQKSTEHSVAELGRSVAELRQSVAELAEAQKETNPAVKQLSDVVGGTVEEDAKALLEYIADQNGWQIISEPSPLDINGEIDVIAAVRDESEKRFTLLCEAKTRLRPADVSRFQRTLNNLPTNIEIMPDGQFNYVYGLAIYPGTRQKAQELGFGLLSPKGELVKPG